MIKTLKFESGDNLFWSSDIHDSHERDFILKPRGYSSAEEARNNLIKLWNNQVDKNGIVFHLGDIVVGAGQNGYEALTSLLDQLNFKEIYLMAGNHPSGWNQLYKKGTEDKEYNLFDHFGRKSLYYNGRLIYFIPNYYEIKVGSKLVVMSHYPMASWNKVGKGSFAIHGHCHNNYELGKYQSKQGKILDVGIESALSYSKREKTLFDYQDILHIMNTKNINQVDHH